MQAHAQDRQLAAVEGRSVKADDTVNRVMPLSFSGKYVRGIAVDDVRDFPIQERSIVINVGMQNAPVTGQPTKVLRPLTSTILQNAVVEKADRLVLLQMEEQRNIGRIVFENGWKRFWDILVEQMGPEGAAATGFPRETPLWRSSQDAIGTVSFDPRYLTGQRQQPSDLAKFTVKVNLWFTPESTDCAIHNRHDFIEVHTQVHGTGRMQKFRTQDPKTLYEDILMSPGFTTSEPFCEVTDDGRFAYPWHQYYSDTDCIWLAIEYHPA